MDDAVIRSTLKWPNVPAVYGWLHLDRRGNWRVRSESGGLPHFESIRNAALNGFIGRNYAADARGCWYFQNGPQRVFVALAYAPFVYRLEGEGFADQTGRPVARFDAAWMDEEGSLVLMGDNGVGVLDDRDLGTMAEELAAGFFIAGETRVALGSLTRGELERRFAFVRDPQP